MAWNRHHAARLLAGPESAASEAGLPDDLDADKEAARRDKSEPTPAVSPHAGRTGSLGARAERPSEGSVRPGRAPAQPPGRGGKAPSS